MYIVVVNLEMSQRAKSANKPIVLNYDCAGVVSATHFAFLSLLHKFTDKLPTEDIKSNTSERK